jgi:hypothetical protein
MVHFCIQRGQNLAFKKRPSKFPRFEDDLPDVDKGGADEEPQDVGGRALHRQDQHVVRLTHESFLILTVFLSL